MILSSSFNRDVEVKKSEEQVAFFEKYMRDKGIDYGYKKTYIPQSFVGFAIDKTVIDTDIGMFFIDDKNMIYDSDYTMLNG
ncbi:hypothetical protein R6Z02_00065 [Carnobacterium maltaromaticum]|uniref:hypothetical protein n=1 Tax=Carnobacterium maltaromaticum TaxID=2751 RepID=UPI00298A81F6|nr:hypothetical protein [Carnobacterium maltaromaticum]MDW5522125.1 hypothetical protein [Carnobacterium maltaromaticum]